MSIHEREARVQTEPRMAKPGIPKEIPKRRETPLIPSPVPEKEPIPIHKPLEPVKTPQPATIGR